MKGYCVLGAVLALTAVTMAAPTTQPAVRRWTLLPRTVRDVYVDGKGRAWFEDSNAMLPEEEFHRLTRLAMTGETNSVPAKILLVDSRGTLWMRPHNSADLVGFDGKDWTVQHPLPPESKPIKSSQFWQQGWEDAHGNLFFPDRCGLFWKSPKGAWNHLAMFERNEAEARYAGYNRGTDGQLHITTHAATMGAGPGYNECSHLIAPDGSVYAWAGWGGNTGTLGIFRFDGKAWTHFDAKNGFPYEEIVNLLPMPDGSIGVMPLAEGFQPFTEIPLRFWRIPGPTGEPAGLSDLISELGNEDPVRREASTDAITCLGPSVLPALEHQLTLIDDPEAQARLRTVINRLKQSPPGRYAARFDCKVMGATVLLNHGVMLWVKQCRDTVANQLYPEAKILIEPKKPWRLIPTKPHDPAEHPSFFQDGLGRIWIGDGRSDIVEDGVTQPKPIIPKDMSLYRPYAGPDALGRMYFKNNMIQFAVLDEKVPESSGPMAGVEHWPATGWATPSSDGSVWAWRTNDAGIRTIIDGHGSVQRWRDGKWETLPGTPTAERLHSMIPLKNGGVLVVLESQEEKVRRVAAFYDGTKWQQGNDLRELVAAHADALRALFDPDHAASDLYERVRLDAAGNFWVAQWERFARYDGKNWLDITGVIHQSGKEGVKFDQPGDLQVFDSGKGIYVQGYANNYTRLVLTFRGNDIVVGKMPGSEQSSPPMDRFVIDRKGNLWARGARRKDELAMFAHAGDPPTYIMPGGRPLFCDTQNRIWSVSTNNGLLHVHLGDADSSLTLDGATWASRLAETPDGRIFLFHSKGMSELVLSGEGKHLVLSEKNNWVEGFPIGKEALCFFSDTHGSLWLLTSGQLLRFTPPG